MRSMVVLGTMLLASMSALRLSSGLQHRPSAEVLRHFGRQLASVAGAVPAGANRAMLLQVNDQVRERNQKLYDHAQRFVDDGWKFVDETEPDPQLISLDPAALGAKREALQHQLQSNSFAGADLDRVRAIAESADDSKTRALAIEALGRSDDARARDHLMSLYAEFPALEDRRRILTYLRPSNENGPVAEFLARQAAASDTPEPLREQALSHLVAAGFMSKVPARLIDRAQQLQAKLRIGGAR